MSFSVVASQRSLCLGSWVDPETTIEFSAAEEEDGTRWHPSDTAAVGLPLSSTSKIEVVDAVPPLADDEEKLSDRSGSGGSVSTITYNEPNHHNAKGPVPKVERKLSKGTRGSTSKTLSSSWKFSNRSSSFVSQRQISSTPSHHPPMSRASLSKFTSASVGRIPHLIRSLWSEDSQHVCTSLVHLHVMIDTSEARAALETDLHDNTLELSLVRRGGHLALLHAMATHVNHVAVQSMGWAALSWLCERCTIKSVLVGKGAVALVTRTLKQPSVSPSVTTEALYLLAHLCTLPKVAEQVTIHDGMLAQLVVRTLPGSAHAEEIIDALFFFCQTLAAHESSKVLHAMWEAGTRKMVVRFMQESLKHWDAADQEGDHEACQAYEDRLAVGCAICTHWAKTPFPSGGHVAVVRALIEAGALTVSAELLRLFPAGTALRKAANPCLRAMVPEAED